MASGSLCKNSSSDGSTDRLVTWPIPALRKSCRLFCEQRASLELQVSNRGECCRRRNHGSSRISLWHRWRPRLCCTALSKGTQHAKQAKRHDLQYLGPLKHIAEIYFQNKCGTYQRLYVAIPSNSTTH